MYKGSELDKPINDGCVVWISGKVGCNVFSKSNVFIESFLSELSKTRINSIIIIKKTVVPLIIFLHIQPFSFSLFSDLFVLVQLCLISSL